MDLFTDSLRRQLLANGRQQASRRGTLAECDFFPVVKWFNPCGAATWLITELEPDTPDIAWGLCDLGIGYPEFGTVSVAELETYRGPLGLGIERDLHWAASAPISVYIEAAATAGRIVDLPRLRVGEADA